MGYPLKEVLKTICGVNQWSYAIFWKIGCQNPKLLIWEDCYHELMSCFHSNSKSGNQRPMLEQLTNCWLSHEAYAQQLSHVDERVHFLVNKMMMTNQVHVVGEGLVGRTAFAGNHEWIVSGNFNEMVHPPEVLSEVHLQFSAGMQTIAVIPVMPHGVIQLGSSLAMMENILFIQDVKTLILQLVCVRSPLLSGNTERDGPVEELGSPFNRMKYVSLDPYGNMNNISSNVAFDGGTRVDLFQDSVLVNQTSCSLSNKIQENLKPTALPLQMHNQYMPISHGGKGQPSTFAEVDSSFDLKGQVGNKVVGAQVISLAPDVLLKHQTSSYDLPSGSNHDQAVANDSCHALQQQHVVGSQYCAAEQNSVASTSAVQNQIHSYENQFSDCWTSTGSGIQIVNSSKKIVDGLYSVVDELVTSGEISGSSVSDDFPDKCREKDLYEGLNIAVSEETDQLSSAREDLFDALGVDFKNKFLNGYICRPSKDGPDMVNQMKGGSLDFTSFLYPDCDSMSESCMFSGNGSDHLLDAVVSGVQSAATQSSSENLSCRTTLTKGSISSVPSSSPVYGLCSISHQMDELFGHSRPSMRSVDVGASSSRSAFGKSDAENCAQTTSYSGSHISSWVDQGSTVKLENTVATTNSKNFNVVGKPMRKKFKPSENPRPRPKDRQMIQDRLKELREIVPNGAKCSIDALLEQTIKHMLFLQSVNKHADKLKQTVESKIINKDGGLLQKGNFEGGATWAYEVGSQAKMCPIIVEDLHSPHQFLVEMLCEERGFFLEIADVIRGMGLTILKGVIEKRNDKIWAHFAVEANREITRMEIFLSLVHLLENTTKNNNIPTNEGFNDCNTFIPPTFDPATSVSGN